jgi:putative inorganic carbon (HCO3(-)) transporter
MHRSTHLWLPSSLKSNPERIAFLFLAGSVAFVLVSIAVSQIFLAAAIVTALWLVQAEDKHFDSKPSGMSVDTAMAAGELPPTLPPIVWPLGAFVLWTVITALSTSHRLAGLMICKKFFIFLLLLLIPLILSGAGRIIWTYRAIFTVSAVAGAGGLLQYAVQPDRDLLHRISGFMSQWMTYSGLLMLVLVLLAAYATSQGWRCNRWAIPLGLFLAAPLYLTETRSAWLGAVVGLTVVLLLNHPRALALLVVLIAAVAMLSPPGIQQRFRSGFDAQDPNTRNRIELFETSVRLIRDNPWLGVGPGNVKREALRYRGTYEFPDWMYQHMHNNFFQIAAERGIPGLLLWLWFMARLAWDALRLFRFSKVDPRGSAAARTASAAALGACAALLVSGLFEYNFGDSEVLTLFLFIAGATYAFPIGSGTAALQEITRSVQP